MLVLLNIIILVRTPINILTSVFLSSRIQTGRTKKSILTKIDNLRSAFRREQKKVEGSKKSAASTD